MKWQNSVYPHPKISVIFVKQSGQAEWVMGMYLLLFLAILLCVQLQISVYRISAAYLEDALAASNLASAVIDLEEYGISHTIQVKNPTEAYILFCDAVKGNLRLNDNWEHTSEGLIGGVVTVRNYTVYNVKDKLVTIYQVFPNGSIQIGEEVLGNVWAPNGSCIESTSIYSEIEFPVKGLFGVEIMAHKGKLVDVVSTEELMDGR